MRKELAILEMQPIVEVAAMRFLPSVSAEVFLIRISLRLPLTAGYKLVIV